MKLPDDMALIGPGWATGILALIFTAAILAAAAVGWYGRTDRAEVRSVVAVMICDKPLGVLVSDRSGLVTWHPEPLEMGFLRGVVEAAGENLSMIRITGRPCQGVVT
jgi:hypothetical protein